MKFVEWCFIYGGVAVTQIGAWLGYRWGCDVGYFLGFFASIGAMAVLLLGVVMTMGICGVIQEDLEARRAKRIA